MEASNCKQTQDPLPLIPLEAERLVRRAESTLQAHQTWIRNTLSMLVCRTVPDEKELHADRKLRATITKWFLYETNEHVRNHPAFCTVAQSQLQLDELVNSLSKSVRNCERITESRFRTLTEITEQFNKSFESLLQTFRDISRSVDPLTGVANRFAMLPRLEQEYDRSQRTGQACSVCMIDLDHFKSINDTHGHQAGDTVLQTVADHLFRNLRPYDQVYRFGGDEFLLMLPDTSPRAAIPVIDRLRQRISGNLIPLSSEISARITASFGIALLYPPCCVQEVIGNADTAMYAAKRAGRNQIRVWHN